MHCYSCLILFAISWMLSCPPGWPYTSNVVCDITSTEVYSYFWPYLRVQVNDRSGRAEHCPCTSDFRRKDSRSAPVKLNYYTRFHVTVMVQTYIPWKDLIQLHSQFWNHVACCEFWFCLNIGADQLLSILLTDNGWNIQLSRVIYSSIHHAQ